VKDGALEFCEILSYVSLLDRSKVEQNRGRL
jgi:hypothetical protein